MIDDRGATYYRSGRYELKRGNNGFSCADWDEKQIIFTISDSGVIKYLTENAEDIYKHIVNNLSDEFRERFYERVTIDRSV